MRISPWCPLRTVPDDDGTKYVFETTKEDLSGTTATKGKVAEIATESVTTFDRILIVLVVVLGPPGGGKQSSTTTRTSTKKE
jgi:hypothetical protein